MDVISIAIEKADKNFQAQADLDPKRAGEIARRYPSVLQSFSECFYKLRMGEEF
jgi:hypothetical protein